MVRGPLYVKKIRIGAGKSIRSTIWQGNRISNNDATLIIMRLPPYSDRFGNRRERGQGEENERSKVSPADGEIAVGILHENP